MKPIIRKILKILAIILVIGFLIPQSFKMPVSGATQRSYSQASFWYYPWGESLTHKGVDIFAKKGTVVHSSTYGIVIFTGQLRLGGNVVLVLGPKWRLHYYAHLDRINTSILSALSTGSEIGTVGASGNAAGKPAHLHYTIRTLVPYPWRIDKSVQGWRKMFYLNPVTYLNESLGNDLKY
jgi:murein DD-endopeptidase MepM/ murein hydrolase activator NlpD